MIEQLLVLTYSVCSELRPTRALLVSSSRRLPLIYLNNMSGLKCSQKLIQLSHIAMGSVIELWHTIKATFPMSEKVHLKYLIFHYLECI